MRAFAQAWPEQEFVQEVLAQLPWYHQIALLYKFSNATERRWYARKAIEHGWSPKILVMQIETQLIQQQGNALSNFAMRLPPAQSELAQATVKDLYIFNFLGLTNHVRERDIESGLMQHVTRFLPPDSCLNLEHDLLLSADSTG